MLWLKDQRMITSIVIPAFNQLAYCEQCIRSIQLSTRAPYKLILVDNGSTDGVSEYFDSVHGAAVVHSETNLGFAGGVNLGMREAEGDVLLLNSDTIVPDGWLGRLSAALHGGDDIGIVGPMSNCVSGSQLIEGLEFTSHEAITAYADELAARNAGQLRDVARLVGFCMLIREEVVAKIGLLDEAYGIGNFEDDDYCLRALRAGYRLCVAEDSFVFHYGSRTFMSMGLVGDDWNQLIEANQRIFEEKWNARPEERVDVIQQARQLAREAKAAAGGGDVAGALRLFRDSLALAPTDDRIYIEYAAFLQGVGETDRAAGFLRRALALNPANRDAEAALRALDAPPEA